VTVPTDLPVLGFADQAALEAWLEAEHATARSRYVELATKGAGVPSVTYPILVESVLRFGWIDGGGSGPTDPVGRCSRARARRRCRAAATTASVQPPRP
jgi:hypothetical protein